MSSYYLKCRKNTKSISPIVSKTNNGKTMTSKKRVICGSKNQNVLKKETSGILSNLGL